MAYMLRVTAARLQGVQWIACIFLVANPFLGTAVGLGCFHSETIFPNCTSLQDTPECGNKLQVNCSSDGGYIETPGWNFGKEYPGYMNSCVTLHVPSDSVIMVSLVSIDVNLGHFGNCYKDYLLLGNEPNCISGIDLNKICKAQHLPPSVLGDPLVSILFVSGSDSESTGFRLLYSFHRKSEEPQKLSNGQWNCSVPYYELFQHHFTCLAQIFCADRRDKGKCPEDNLCGPSLLKAGDSCYRFFQPSSKRTSWDNAADTCSKYGGHLAIMNSDSRRQTVMEIIRNKRVPVHVFVGLSIASAELPEMYKFTWTWSDETLAVYFNITFAEVAPPYCAAVNGASLQMTMVTCSKKLNSAFLCGTNFVSDEMENTTRISMATPSGWNTRYFSKCRDNHTTHTFLACDVTANCSVESHYEILACSTKFTPPVPFFTCRNQVERVPYTLVCNHRSDCCDDSDEDFCQFPDCQKGKKFTCADDKQCISRELACNKRRDCVDGSDENGCKTLLAGNELPNNTVKLPVLVTFSGYGNFIAKHSNDSLCPETHFQCPGGGYCLPVYVRCNEVYDCPGKEDELDCDHYTCPGFYRCRESKICLHREHLCDDVFQCPQHDDELMCNFTCPENCLCYGYAFICTGWFQPDIYLELRYLDASNTGMYPEYFLNNTKLIHLGLRNCDITMIGQLDFPNLHSLDLSYNYIPELNSSHFIKLENLISISLAYNSLMSLDSVVYTELKFVNIINVNLSGIAIPEINDAVLKTFPNVRYLNISGSGLKKIPQEGFQSLSSLRMLDLRGCPLDTFSRHIFKGLHQLERVYTDNFKLCCPEVLPAEMDTEKCQASIDSISSCDALLKTDIFRIFFVLYAILALTGNLGSFVYTNVIHGSHVKMGYKVFVTHLFVADFLMGVYLAIVGIADRIYFGKYQWHDTDWKQNVVCKLAGFLSLASREVSACLVCLITVERFLVICFPHKSFRFNRQSAHTASMTVWLIGMILAGIPLLPMTSHWHFYSQSGICNPLPITDRQYEGREYAFALIVTNFILFLLIAVVQFLIYWFIRINAGSSREFGGQSKDTVVARHLMVVVMTNFVCWFLIGLMGIMVYHGIPISSGINLSVVVFVLPFNAALNPILLTVRTVKERRHDTSGRTSKNERREAYTIQNSGKRVFNVETESTQRKKNYCREEALQLFDKFLDEGLLTPVQIRDHMWGSSDGAN